MGYVELELRGPGERAVGFVEGFRAALGDQRPVWYSRQGLGHASLVDALRDKLGLSSTCVLPEELASAVRAALAARPALELAVQASEPVEAAEAPFTFRCFSREVAAGVRALVEGELPAGVRLEGYEAAERADADAGGAELYSPAHDYTLSGEGTYRGAVEGVLRVAERLRGHDFLHLGPVRLRRRP